MHRFRTATFDLENGKRLQNNKNMKTTIKDIARDVGVNVATVSRALNNKPGVSPELRRTIQRRAAELNYLPYGQARSLVTRRTETVGLLFDMELGTLLSNPFYSEVLAGIEAEIRQHDYSLMFASTSGEPVQHFTALPKFIVEHRVDGVIVVGSVEANIIDMLITSGQPFVIVDYHLPDRHLDAVLADNVRGAYAATELLIGLGHRTIAFVGGEPLDHGNFGERLEGYRRALNDAGIPFQDDLVAGGGIENGDLNALQILARRPDTTAVIACNDTNAIAALNALQRKGYGVPDRISIVGFDDIPHAARTHPPLTTVHVDRRGMGRAAALRLIHKLHDNDSQPECETVFPAKLVVRESSGPPPAAKPADSEAVLPDERQ